MMRATTQARKPIHVPDIDALPPSALLTRNQLVASSGFALITFKKWAREGRGPKITYVEGRPRYRVGDVKAWTSGQA